MALERPPDGTVLPSGRVKIPLSLKGPQVGVPGMTSLGWLRLRQSAGLPGLAEVSTRR